MDLQGLIRKIIMSDYFLESITGIPNSLAEPASYVSEEDLIDPSNILQDKCSSCHNGIQDYIRGGALPSAPMPSKKG